MEFKSFFEEFDIDLDFLSNKSVKKNLSVAQHEMLNFIHTNPFLVIYKGRQEGVSTCITLYLLWTLLTKPGITIGMLYTSTHEREVFRQTINMNLDKINLFFSQFNIECILTEKNHNVNVTKFPNGSTIHYWNKNNKSAGRGHRMDFIYVSELSFSDNFIQLISTLFPCVAFSKDGKFLLTTTDLRNLKEDFNMNGDLIIEYWSDNFFSGTRRVMIEKLKRVNFKL